MSYIQLTKTDFQEILKKAAEDKIMAMMNHFSKRKSYSFALLLICSFLVLCASSNLFAANHYIRDGAIGSDDGSDWTNAWTALPATLTRGDTYYIADGSYDSYIFDDANSGTTYIYIKKAVEAAHGTGTGWNSAYGDGKASFTDIAGTNPVFLIETGYYDIDGVTGGGPDSWYTGHGFLLTGTWAGQKVVNFRGPAWGAENMPVGVRLRHMELTHRGRYLDTSDDLIYSTVVLGVAGTSDTVVEYCYIHNVTRIPINIISCSDWIIQYSCIARNSSTDLVHSEAIQAYGGDDMTVRWNLFEDIEGTAIIAFKRGSTEALNRPGSNWHIYGNIVWNTPENRELGTGWGIFSMSGVGDAVNDGLKIYNNTIANLHGGSRSGIAHFNGDTAQVYNNIWYDCDKAPGDPPDFDNPMADLYFGNASIGTAIVDSDYNNYIDAGLKVQGRVPSPEDGQVGANDLTSSSLDSTDFGIGLISSADPFVDWQNRDFRLEAKTTTGTTLPAPYNTDMYGNTRGAGGNWSRGAIQYTGPTAEAGPDTDYNGSEEVTLDGSASTVYNGTIVSYVWTDDLGDTIPDGETVDVNLSVGIHTITLTVTDDDGQEDTDTVTIEIVTADIDDDFSDNQMGNNWQLHAENPNNIWLDEINERLELRSTDSLAGIAEYISNQWMLDPSLFFSMKIDFHYDPSDTLDEGDDGRVFLSISPSLSNWEDHYLEFSAGRDEYNGEPNNYFYYEVINENVTLESGSITRNDPDGSLYIFYYPDVNELNLSYTDGENTYALQTVLNLIQDTWNSDEIYVSIGGGATSVIHNSGDAYLYDFVVVDGTDLVADWSMDEGSGSIAGDSAGTNDGTIYGAEWAEGAIGGALSFNGSSDYVDFANDSSLQITNEMTISAWIKTSSSNKQFIVSRDDITNRCYTLFIVNDKVRFQVFKESNLSRIDSSVSVNDGLWHHVVAVNDGTNLKIYVDGAIEGINSGGGGAVRTNNVDLWIGARNDLTNYFNGSIDAVKLFSSALLADDVLLLYNESAPAAPDMDPPTPDPMGWATAPTAISDTEITMTAETADDVSGVEYYFTCTAGGGNDSSWQSSTTYTDTGLQAETQYTYTAKARDLSANQNTTSASTPSSATTDAASQPDDGLVSHWSLDEGSGSIAGDSAGANDGTIHGAEWAAGAIGGALSFNGSSDYIDCGNDSSMQITDEMTISAWIKTSSGAQQFIISKDDIGNRCYTLFMVNSMVRFQIFKEDRRSYVDSSISVRDGNWHHIVAINDGTNLEVYVDGVLKGTNYGGGGTVDNENVNMWIGARNDLTHYFNGSIDTVKLFSSALLADDVLLLYNESAPAAPDTDPPTPDPMGWATAPAAISDTEITMTAETADDVSGVEYYFTCTAGGGNDSSWQSSTTYTDTGLQAETQYSYTVKARDLSANQNTTATSILSSATTDPAPQEDTVAPSPDTMTWVTVPTAISDTAITMTATTATDASGVEYYFTCTAGGGNDSGWQSSATYTDADLQAETQYTYTVKARDLSANQNTTSASTPSSATTDAASQPDDGLVSHWSLDEGSGSIAGDSAGANDGTIYGAEWAAGAIGGALSFNGSSDYVDFGNDSSMQITDEMTISAWIKTSSGAQQFIISKDDIGNRCYTLFMVNGMVRFQIFKKDRRSYVDSSISVRDGKWHHVVAVNDGTNLEVYVDGVRKGINYGGGGTVDNENVNMWIGARNDLTHYFNGSIDTVKLFNSALLADDILLLYNETSPAAPDTDPPSPDTMTWVTVPTAISDTAITMTAATATDASGVEYYFTCTAGGGNDSSWQSSAAYTDIGLQAETQYSYTVKARDLSAGQNTTLASISSSAATDPAPQPDASLLSYWSLEEGSGSVAYDFAGTNDGTIYGAEWAAGAIDGALSFNGSSDYIDCGNDSSLQITDEMTISAWIKTSSGDQQFIVSKDDIGNRCYTLFMVNGMVRFQIFKKDRRSYVDSSISVRDGKWHHVVAVNDGTNLKIYVDGVRKGINYGGGGTVDNENVNMWIGARNDLAYYFNGSIDEINVFDKSLTSVEITSIYNTGSI